MISEAKRSPCADKYASISDAETIRIFALLSTQRSLILFDPASTKNYHLCCVPMINNIMITIREPDCQRRHTRYTDTQNDAMPRSGLVPTSILGGSHHHDATLLLGMPGRNAICAIHYGACLLRNWKRGNRLRQPLSPIAHLGVSQSNWERG